MNNLKLIFKAEPCSPLDKKHLSLLERIWQQGKSLRGSVVSKDDLSKKLEMEVKEALVLDNSFLLVVSLDEERVYEIA